MELAIFYDQPEITNELRIQPACGDQASVQLVQEPDFYGVGGQDLTTGMCSQEKRGKFGIALKISDFTGGDTWIIDSGASDHMTFDKSFFSSLSPSPIQEVSNANGVSFPVLGIGSIQVTPTLVLNNVLYVPALSHHLLSVSELNSQSKCSVTFFPMYVIFQDLSTQAVIDRGDLRGRLFHLDCMYSGETRAPSPTVALTLNSDRVKQIWLWHRRMGHPSFGVMKKSMPSLFVGIKESSLHCETCVFAKSHKSSYSPSLSSSSAPFELIHSDVWGPSKNLTLTGMKYFVLFIDDFTRLSWVVLLKKEGCCDCVFCLHCFS